MTQFAGQVWRHIRLFIVLSQKRWLARSIEEHEQLFLRIHDLAKKTRE